MVTVGGTHPTRTGEPDRAPVDDEDDAFVDVVADFRHRHRGTVPRRPDAVARRRGDNLDGEAAPAPIRLILALFLCGMVTLDWASSLTGTASDLH